MVKTNAVRVLDTLGIKYELREYQVDPDDLSAGTVAAKIGADDRIENRSEYAAEIAVETELIVRQSTGPAPNAM